MKALAGALLQAQKSAPALPRDSINPGFKGSKYISLDSLLDAILPVLNECGIVLVQSPTVAVDGRPALRTKLLHAESGEFEEDTMLLELERDTPQAQGSAITYARRYSLMSMLGLSADLDDDGNAASKVKARQPDPASNRHVPPPNPKIPELEERLYKLCIEFNPNLPTARIKEKVDTQRGTPAFQGWLEEQVAKMETSLNTKRLEAQEERDRLNALALDGAEQPEAQVESPAFVAPTGKRGEKAAA